LTCLNGRRPGISGVPAWKAPGPPRRLRRLSGAQPAPSKRTLFSGAVPRPVRPSGGPDPVARRVGLPGMPPPPPKRAPTATDLLRRQASAPASSTYRRSPPAVPGSSSDEAPARETSKVLRVGRLRRGRLAFLALGPSASGRSTSLRSVGTADRPPDLRLRRSGPMEGVGRRWLPESGELIGRDAGMPRCRDAEMPGCGGAVLRPARESARRSAGTSPGIRGR
jgi:hypothetical protein